MVQMMTNQIFTVLKSVVECCDPIFVAKHKHISFFTETCCFLFLQHLCFVEYFHCIHFTSVLLFHYQYLNDQHTHTQPLYTPQTHTQISTSTHTTHTPLRKLLCQLYLGFQSRQLVVAYLLDDLSMVWLLRRHEQ